MAKRTRIPLSVTRRRFIAGASAGAGLALSGALAAPSLSFASARPRISHGLQSGDVGTGSGVIWARADRPSRLLVDYATTESFANARQVAGPAAISTTDFTAKLELRDLPAGQEIFYRVRFQDLADVKLESEPLVGRFRTAPGERRSIRFCWTGDTCGQGWGINEDWGGMKGYEAMRRSRPDFMIHSGDTIYADGPLEAEKAMEDGSVWKNVMTKEKSKVAETLTEFRGNYQYNLIDANVQRFNAEVPVFAQWDDHETVNNWYPNEVLADDRYGVKSVALLAARANRAFLEYMPIKTPDLQPERIHRVIHYGPLLDIFMIDKRSFRADNSANRQAQPGSETAFLGRRQIAWLKSRLLASKATWKVIASDMPVGLLVRDGEQNFENGANGDGPVLGREHDIAEILRFIKHNRIRNTVWFTADVHYTAAHYYDPNRAQFQDFEPFWEFVSGPIHAGSFGPNDLDNTFGPEVRYVKAPPEGRKNLPPSDGLQFFGQVDIDGESAAMTVTLKDIAEQDLYSVTLEPSA